MIDVQKNAVERRRSDRFAIEREVRYCAATTRNKGIDEQGGGKTLNMSSKGILFEASQPQLAGRRLQVSVNWPAQLNNNCPLQLVVKGMVVRSDGNFVAIEILQSEFRTVSKAKLV